MNPHLPTRDQSQEKAEAKDLMFLSEQGAFKLAFCESMMRGGGGRKTRTGQTHPLAGTCQLVCQPWDLVPWFPFLSWYALCGQPCPHSQRNTGHWSRKAVAMAHSSHAQHSLEAAEDRDHGSIPEGTCLSQSKTGDTKGVELAVNPNFKNDLESEESDKTSLAQ